VVFGQLANSARRLHDLALMSLLASRPASSTPMESSDAASAAALFDQEEESGLVDSLDSAFEILGRVA
jgi:hypothetical protein